MSQIRTYLTLVAAAALMLVPAATALAADVAAPSGALSLSQAAEPAPADDPADPAVQASADPAPAQAPAATPAQDDVSGGNEYQESGPPTATGDPTTPETSEPETDPTPTTSAPTGGGSAPAAEVSASETTDETAEAADGLPRTGAESWIIALIGITLLGTGTLLRRAYFRQR
jgi:eukaryotic-like serine/threonine-protein kinase